jgi:lysophospholipase L1-like esterase
MTRTFALLTSLCTFLIGACSAPVSPVAAEPTPIRYVAIGASDSVGVGAAEPASEGWVARLYEHLPAGSSLTNLGISGSLLSEAIEQQLPVAQAARPDLVTVWLAVNDLNARVPVDQYAADLEVLLDGLSSTGAQIYIGNVPDLARVPVYRNVDARQLAQVIERWNSAIAGAASRHGAHLVDLRPTWQEMAEHPEYVSADGFHPSSAGYSRLAEVFWEAIQTSGGVSSLNRE